MYDKRLTMYLTIQLVILCINFTILLHNILGRLICHIRWLDTQLVSLTSAVSMLVELWNMVDLTLSSSFKIRYDFHCFSKRSVYC